MLSMRWNQFPVCSACDEISSPYAQCAIKFVLRMLSMDCTCKNVHILPLAEHARKFVPCMLSMRWNRFRVCSACDKIISAYAQHTHAIIFENSGENRRKRSEIFEGHIRIWFRSKKIQSYLMLTVCTFKGCECSNAHVSVSRGSEFYSGSFIGAIWI